MKTILFAVASALAIVAAVNYYSPKKVTASSPVEDAWTHWKQTMGKTYGTDTEETYRFGVFNSNYDAANDFNSQEGQTAKLGMTVFADLTLDEFVAQYTGLKGMKNLTGTRKATPKMTVPDSVDWTTVSGHVNKVQNQGQCGSCWAFGTVAAFEGEYARKNGNLLKFSEQRLVDCAGGSYGNLGCNGGEFDGAYNYMKDHGNVAESDYPYTGQDGTCKTMDPVAGTIPKSFAQLEQGEVALKTGIARGPVAVGVDAASLTWQLYFGGVTQGWTCGTSIDHAVAAVGYGETSLLGIHLPYWKIRNSWGSWWGESGYIRMKRTANDTGKGVCGVQSQAWQVNLD